MPWQRMSLGDLTLLFWPTSNGNWDPWGAPKTLLTSEPNLTFPSKTKTNGNNKLWFSTPWNFRYLLSFSWLGCRKENREEKKNDENNVWHLSSSSRKTIEMIWGRLVGGTGVKGGHSRNATLCQHFHFPKVTSLYTTFRLSNFFHSESHIYTGDALWEKLPQVC